MDKRTYTILIADDEIELANALELYFKKEQINVIKADNGREALDLFAKMHPDLVLLDVMMPETNGFKVLSEIRKTSEVPAIMLTARTDSPDQIKGLGLGADDYITKPYVPQEVVARVKAQLRRSYRYNEKMISEKERAPITAGSLVLDQDRGTLTKDGVPISLSATEFRIMELLMSSPGKIFTKRQIYESAWSDSYVSDSNTIMVRISSIRHKIGDDTKHPKIIVTVKGLGYKFEAPDA